MATKNQNLARTQEQKKQTEKSGSLSRSFSMLSIRAVENEERTVELSFSSEEAYERWWGVEILDHSESSVDLNRLNEIGCMLFNHNRDYVIGKIVNAWVLDGRCMAKVRFDEDDAADVIYKKVQNGTLKGVSTGYRVATWETVPANKKSQDGRFTGPCDIAKKWFPFEISIVSIPADATVGVGRSYDNEDEAGRTLDYFNRQIQINKNKFKEDNLK